MSAQKLLCILITPVQGVEALGYSAPIEFIVAGWRMNVSANETIIGSIDS